jgi:hypothetical protein
MRFSVYDHGFYRPSASTRAIPRSKLRRCEAKEPGQQLEHGDKIALQASGSGYVWVKTVNPAQSPFGRSGHNRKDGSRAVTTWHRSNSSVCRTASSSGVLHLWSWCNFCWDPSAFCGNIMHHYNIDMDCSIEWPKMLSLDKKW